MQSIPQDSCRNIRKSLAVAARVIVSALNLAACGQHVERANDIINREFIREEKDFPYARCMESGLDFLARNADADNWLLQIEPFDPHEPFYAPARFREAFPTDYRGPVLDWPRYGGVDELREECEELRANYYATVAHCDELLGRLLDVFDARDFWQDTALVVTTDHGFLLGEHDFWAKNRMNLYREVEHIPLLVHDPRVPARPGESCAALTQTIDLAATFLDLFNVAPTPNMEGIPLRLTRDGSHRREALIFGYFGGAVNVTDGRFTYHRFPPDLRRQEIYQYTLMPTHIIMPFTVEELADIRIAGPLPFTKGAKVMQVPVIERSPMFERYGPGALLENETRLYDLAADPGQARPVRDVETEARLVELMRCLMLANDAPAEAFVRLQLTPP